MKTKPQSLAAAFQRALIHVETSPCADQGAHDTVAEPLLTALARSATDLDQIIQRRIGLATGANTNRG